jgi:hypothetical protein
MITHDEIERFRLASLVDIFDHDWKLRPMQDTAG